MTRKKPPPIGVKVRRRFRSKGGGLSIRPVAIVLRLGIVLPLPLQSLFLPWRQHCFNKCHPHPIVVNPAYRGSPCYRCFFPPPPPLRDRLRFQVHAGTRALKRSFRVVKNSFFQGCRSYWSFFPKMTAWYNMWIFQISMRDRGAISYVPRGCCLSSWVRVRHLVVVALCLIVDRATWRFLRRCPKNRLFQYNVRIYYLVVFTNWIDFLKCFKYS